MSGDKAGGGQTCSTCRWWGASGDDFQTTEPDRKHCDSPRILRSYHIPLEEVPVDGALVEPDEGWGIFTGAEFGCVAWEHESAPEEAAK